MPTSASRDVAIFLHSGEYDRMHQGLSIAATAVANERPVRVFFFWWALQRLAQDDLDEPDWNADKSAVSNRFQVREFPTLRSLLKHLRNSDLCHMYACTGSLALIEASAGIEKWSPQMVGWSAILELTAGVSDRFYI